MFSKRWRPSWTQTQGPCGPGRCQLRNTRRWPIVHSSPPFSLLAPSLRTRANATLQGVEMRKATRGWGQVQKENVEQGIKKREKEHTTKEMNKSFFFFTKAAGGIFFFRVSNTFLELFKSETSTDSCKIINCQNQHLNRYKRN